MCLTHDLFIFCLFSPSLNRHCKEVIAFDAGDLLAVVEKMQLDLYEPPLSQV